MADVARAAGVSTATVSRVLNSKDSVKPDLAEKVQDAVRELRYVPNSAGRALRRARSDMWAVIVPDAQNPFFTSFLNKFESIASRRNHSVVMCNSHENHARESQYIDAMLAQQVSGIVLAATSATRTSVQRLEDARIPLVLFDRLIRRFRGDSVTVDNVLAGKIAASHMVEQGVRRPIILTGPKTVSSTVDRDAGYRSAFHDAGLALSDDQVLRLDLTAETAAQELAAALSAHPDTDGVFATNGPLTAAAFKSVHGLGWTMPERICFVGVDDEYWTRMVSPTVTVVSQPIDQLGQWAAKLLENRSQQPDADTVRIVLEPHLLVRDSSVRIVTADK